MDKKKVIIFISLVACLIYGSLGVVAVSDASRIETQVKAAIIIGVLRYTSWHEDFSENDEIVVCTRAREYRAQEITRGISKVKIGQRSVSFRNLLSGDAFSDACDVALFGPKLAEGQKVNIEHQSSPQSLVICDHCDATLLAPMVTLVRRDELIGFEVDLCNAAKAGLSFSSDMLELASKVEDCD